MNHAKRNEMSTVLVPVTKRPSFACWAPDVVPESSTSLGSNTVSSERTGAYSLGVYLGAALNEESRRCAVETAYRKMQVDQALEGSFSPVSKPIVCK